MELSCYWLQICYGGKVPEEFYLKNRSQEWLGKKTGCGINRATLLRSFNYSSAWQDNLISLNQLRSGKIGEK